MNKKNRKKKAGWGGGGGGVVGVSQVCLGSMYMQIYQMDIEEGLKC